MLVLSVEQEKKKKKKKNQYKENPCKIASIALYKLRRGRLAVSAVEEGRINGLGLSSYLFGSPSLEPQIEMGMRSAAKLSAPEDETFSNRLLTICWM